MSDPSVNTYVCQRCYKEISSTLTDITKKNIDLMKPSDRLYFIEIFCHQSEEGMSFSFDSELPGFKIINIADNICD